MNVQKDYKLGGFFGNSQDKFSHMAGAERGFDRKKFRELRRAKRKGTSLSGQDAQDLEYMKKVRGDRMKKAIMGGAAAATGLAALGGAAGMAGGVSKIGAGLGKLKTAAQAGKFKGLFGKLKKAKSAQEALSDSGFFRGTGSDTANSGQYGGAPATEIEDMELGEIDEFGNDEEEFDYGGPGGKYGMRILKQGGLVGGQKRLDKNNDGRLSREDFELLRAMFGAKLPR